MKRGAALGCIALAAMVIGMVAVALPACSFYGIGPPPQDWKPSHGPPKCNDSTNLPTVDAFVGYPIAAYGGVATIVSSGAAVVADDDDERDDALGYAGFFAAVTAVGAIWIWASREGAGRSRKCRKLKREYSAYYVERSRALAGEPLEQCAWLVREWQAAKDDGKRKSQLYAMMPEDCKQSLASQRAAPQ